MKAYIDGSSTGMYGYVVPSEKDRLRIVHDYPMTNNQAEWLALLTLFIDLEVNSEITIFSDSQIVVNQFNGAWETKNEALRHLKEVCHFIVDSKHLKVKLNWVPRSENEFGKYLDKIMNKKRKERKEFREKLERGFI